MTDMFNEENTTPATPPEGVVATPSPTEPNPADQLLKGIVNETGEQKYASVDKALEALAASQSYIKKLETENSDYRVKGDKATAMEDILAAIKSRDSGEPAPAPAEATPALDPTQLADMVNGLYNQTKANEVSEANRKAVIEAATAKYGEQVGTKFYEEAAAKGFDKEDINRLAAKNPAAVFSLLNIDGKKDTPLKLESSIRTEGFQQAPAKPVRAMAHGTTGDLLTSWRATVAKVNKDLGIN